MDEQSEAELYEIVVSMKRTLLRVEASTLAVQELLKEAEKRNLLSDDLRELVSSYKMRRDRIWGESTAAIQDQDPGLAARLDEGREEHPLP